MRETIVALLAKIGPMTCDEIGKQVGCSGRLLRRYLYDLRCENRIEGKRVCISRFWAYRYQIPIPIFIPKMQISGTEYMWWHPTGTCPQDVKRLVR